LPVTLVYRERAAGRGAALRREYAIKQMSARAKRELVIGRRGRPKADPIRR
jgi:predicted GIY-YIG superfamily endonuclease